MKTNQKEEEKISNCVKIWNIPESTERIPQPGIFRLSLHEASKQIYFNFWTKSYSSSLSFAYIVLKYLLKVEDFLRTNLPPIIKTSVENAHLIIGKKNYNWTNISIQLLLKETGFWADKWALPSLCLWELFLKYEFVVGEEKTLWEALLSPFCDGNTTQTCRVGICFVFPSPIHPLNAN